MSEVKQRIDDYLEMGVRFVWLIDPETHDGYIYTPQGIERSKEGVLRTSDPEILLRLHDQI